MTGLDRAIQELAKANQPHRLHTKDNNPLVSFQQGLVVGVHFGGLDILLRGTSTPAEEVRYLASYTPGWGDIVWVARFGSDMICLGDLETLPGTGGILNDPVAIEPWHEIGAAGEPAFENSWVNFGAPWETAAYAMQSDGWVRLKGMVKSGNVVGSFFTLPVDYRPPFSLAPTILSLDANMALTMQTSGTIAVATGGSNSWVTLNGVMFPTKAAWEREKDTHWFPLIRSQNGWLADTADINKFPLIYRRGDGFRYLRGEVDSGTVGAGARSPMTDLMPEDAVSFSYMLNAREPGVGIVRCDVAGLMGKLAHIIGGNTKVNLHNLQFWARHQENFQVSNPDYPHQWMQNWVEPTLLNGWAHFNSTGQGEWGRVKYFKDAFGVVHLRGLATGTAKTSNIVLNLPAEYRPLNRQIFPAVRHSAGGGVQGRVDIYPNGDVEALNAVANWHQMFATFKAEQ